MILLWADSLLSNRESFFAPSTAARPTGTRGSVYFVRLHDIELVLLISLKIYLHFCLKRLRKTERGGGD